MTAPKGRGETVLVVEDDPASQSILTRLLKTRGYSVCTASNGHQAMAVTARKNPKLALVDVVLPEVSGMDFLKWLRANHPGIRVIMLSVLEEESTVAVNPSLLTENYLEQERIPRKVQITQNNKTHTGPLIFF